MTPFAEAINTEVNRLGATSGKWRASITYSSQGIEGIKLVQYRLPEITGFRLIEITDNFYSKKWADRSQLDDYKSALPAGIEPIFVLNGLITDTSFTNILLEREGKWYTPIAPLLQGTKRCKLLEDRAIRPILLPSIEVHDYERIHLINAMLDPGELTLSTSAVL